MFWGREHKKQWRDGSYTAYIIFCLKTADDKKLDLISKYDICVFFLWQLASSGSHVTSPQGREPIWSRLNQMRKSHVPAVADGSSGGRSHRDRLSQTSFPCQKLWFFLRPDQMVCKALRYSSYRGLRKDKQVEVKVKLKLLGVMNAWFITPRCSALRAHQEPVSNRKCFKCKF